jgi:mRNA interferase RelE/StbE
MNIRIDETFQKDLRKLKNKPLETKTALLIREIINAEYLTEIKNIKQLRGSTIHYRIRIGDYRVGLICQNNTVYLIRLLHRKKTYRYFP